jgi:predicted aspartyl protease
MWGEREGAMRGLPLTVKVAAAALLAFVGAQAALAQAPPAGAPVQGEIPVETSVATTMSATDRMLAPVTINGAGPYPFIIDTAAERSVIARQLADELRLAPAGRKRLLSISNTRTADLVTMVGVSFMAGEARTLNAFALDGRNIGASGVLGIDALRGQRVTLDFAAGEMRVGPAPRRVERLAPNEIVVRARSRFGQLVLIDSSAEGVPVDVIVDSGLQASVGNEALRRLLTSRRSQFEKIELMSITGEATRADYTRVDKLRIGGVAINGMPIAFANAHFFTRMRLTRRPALLLGMDTLRMFRRVVVDFPNRRAHFVFPEGYGTAPSP